MEKRLSRMDLLFALGFLFMLIVAVGAFFYGVKVGSTEAESRYTQANGTTDVAVKAQTANAYQLQDLVSFYHTVFLPYREFVTEWQDAKAKWLGDATTDRSSALKELVKSAESKYDEMKVAYIPPVSPLLKQSQDQYLKSLKLYRDSLSDRVSKGNDGAASLLIEQIAGDAYYKEGLKLGLAAQEQYYDSMVQWAATVNIDIPNNPVGSTSLGLTSWKVLPLVLKNRISALYLQEQSIQGAFLPQDLTARIDTFLASGQAEKMKLKSVSSVADLLVQTDAVRGGDFLGAKDRFYSKQLVPQLPFFFPDN
ncbi:hypothetical protein [Cohnella zeiphila]|uniref:Uncharacterized protein n=1 Tax=Cohnella zeiphila TaxID=2761120 RepID=A0A7X0STN7_9BACL|nr:hypothetical protein [Cohnella zeiphila]MBB6735791.1 hypothetical protein [Cohnella zeiphila]